MGDNFTNNNNFSFTEVLRKRKKLFKGSNINFLNDNRYLSRHLAIPPGSFLIRVYGDSMINAGISSGDLLIVETSNNSPVNRVVIAELDGKITLKRLIEFENEFYLKPENKNYSLIKVNDYKHFKIWGIATKIIKDVTDRIG